MTILLQDVRYAMRMLFKDAGFTAVLVLTLAFGIGANTAIFSVVNSLLLQPLPMREAKRLVVIWVNNLARGWPRLGPSGLDYQDWQEQAASFEDLFLFEHGSGTVTGLGEPEQVAGLRVTTNFGEFLGVRPVAGRTFAPDESAGPHNVVLLSYGYWQRRFAADEAAVGKTLTLNGETYTIIGVLPPSLWTLFPADLVVPWDRERLLRTDSHLGVFGRLKKGITLQQATAEMNAVANRIAAQRLERRGWGITVAPLQEVVVESIRPALLLLLGAVAFVLLIGCANVANLLLARALARRKEVAIRLALGAGRWRLLRGFLIESLLLAAAGGGLGLLLGLWGIDLLLRLVPATLFIPNAAADIVLPQVRPDVTVLFFAIAVSLLTGLGFGLVPALESLKSDTNASLKAGARGFTGDVGGRRRRAALVTAEIALAFVLVVGAALMMRSFLQLLTVKPGFQPDHVLAFEIKLPTDAKDSRYLAAPQRATVFRQFLEHVQTLPGVTGAGLTEVLPLSQDDHAWLEFTIQEIPSTSPGERLSADFRRVSPGLFQTLGIPLRAGRAFTASDDRNHPWVVAIDEAFARRFFRGTDPLGKHVQNAYISAEIVGVVGGVRDTGLDREPRPTIYLPYEQSPISTMELVVRTTLPPENLAPAVKKAIWAVDKDQPVFKVRTMDQLLAKSVSPQRLAFVLLGVFAAVAILLAVMGTYGAIAYSIGQRTHELGIRMALGAQKADVVSLVLLQGMKLTSAGLAIGLLGALALSRLVRGLLYGVTSTDPAIFAAVSVLVAACAWFSCWLPARRAARVDPLVALKDE